MRSAAQRQFQTTDLGHPTGRGRTIELRLSSCTRLSREIADRDEVVFESKAFSVQANCSESAILANHRVPDFKLISAIRLKFGSRSVRRFPQETHYEAFVRCR